MTYVLPRKVCTESLAEQLAGIKKEMLADRAGRSIAWDSIGWTKACNGCVAFNK